MMLGSPYYFSPEQARGERADARSDLYSTGVMLYEMVTGRPPFDAVGPQASYAIIAAHLHQPPRSPAELNPNVPPALARSILKALAKDPAERFASAQDFLSALDPMRLNDTVTVTVQGARPAPAEPTPSAPAAVSSTIYSDADLERVSKDLATFIGPIARILVKRAAQENQTWSDLYQTLAQEISSVAKREQFLATMPHPSASGSSAVNRSTSGTPSGGSRTSG
jgi:serine/threonine-protein kinase